MTLDSCRPLTRTLLKEYGEFAKILALVPNLRGFSFYSWGSSSEGMEDDLGDTKRMALANEWTQVCPDLRCISFLANNVLLMRDEETLVWSTIDFSDIGDIGHPVFRIGGADSLTFWDE